MSFALVLDEGAGHESCSPALWHTRLAPLRLWWCALRRGRRGRQGEIGGTGRGRLGELPGARGTPAAVEGRRSHLWGDHRLRASPPDGERDSGVSVGVQRGQRGCGCSGARPAPGCVLWRNAARTGLWPSRLGRSRWARRIAATSLGRRTSNATRRWNRAPWWGRGGNRSGPRHGQGGWWRQRRRRGRRGRPRAHGWLCPGAGRFLCLSELREARSPSARRPVYLADVSAVRCADDAGVAGRATGGATSCDPGPARGVEEVRLTRRRPKAGVTRAGPCPGWRRGMRPPERR